MACNESSDFQQAISHALHSTYDSKHDSQAGAKSRLETFNYSLALRTHEIQLAVIIVQRYIQESRYAHETRIALLGNRTHINPLST